MDLTQAAQSHGEWKQKFRLAMQRQEKLDTAEIASDRCCALGRWLHGDAKSAYDKLPAYRECVARHADFHRAAGSVAAAINRGDHAGAAAMLDAGTPYAGASNAVATAILGLDKAIAAAVPA